MAIKIVMIIFILLLLLTSWYMWRQRDGIFLTYDAGSDPRLSNILKWTAIALLIESIIGVIILCLGNKYLNFITLLLASLTILIFSLSITQKKE